MSKQSSHAPSLVLASTVLASTAGVGMATYPPGATFGPRQMRDYEFVWLIQGDAEYRRGSTQVTAPQGSIVLCRPGATDFFQWDSKQRTQHAYFHFQIAQLHPSWPPPDSWPVVREPTNDDLLPDLFRFLLTHIGRDHDASCHIAIHLMLDLFITGESGAAPIPSEPWPEAVERAMNFLHKRLESEPNASITLKELARVAYVTPEHLCRVFKQATGHSPLETVRLARLDHAATLLARTNYSVSEIAAMCGFASPFHFSRKFKEVFDLSPREMRKTVRAGCTPPTPRLLRQRTIG